MTNYEAIYDAAEMRGGKGFSVGGHQAGIAAVVAEAKAEAWDEGERHESEYLATWGQFCPNPENPYRVVSRG